MLPVLALLLALTLTLTPTEAMTYDYVIAGGGTSGLLLALTLSANPNLTIAVLEAGPDARTDPRITIPEREGSIAGTSLDWNFTTTPQPGLYGGKALNVARGKVLGGTSAMNWMIWQRASAVEYDAWESVLKLAGWDWSSISAAARAGEDFVAPNVTVPGISWDAADHGTTGPIVGTMARSLFSLYPNYLVPALKALGVPVPLDRDGGNTTGAGSVPLAIDPASYTRSYPGSAYTLAQNRPNLHLLTSARVTRILWAAGKKASAPAVARGVAYLETSGAGGGGGELVINASHVVLSAGSVQSPQLLELSGIGDPTRLNPLGIASVVALSGVGTQLTDHLTYGGSFSFNHSASSLTGGNYAQNFQDYAPASRLLSAAEHAATSKMLKTAAVPVGVSAAAWAMFKAMWAADEPMVEFAWFLDFVTIYTLHPLSQGSVHINSSDPLAAPVLDPGYNSALVNGTAWDLWLLSKAAVWLAETLARSPPFAAVGAKYSVNASLPFAQVQAMVVQGLASGAHLTGGAVMGPRGKGGVVDAGLKVYGTRNVYVVDCSVVPVSPGQHPMGLAYAIAMKAAGILQA